MCCFCSTATEDLWMVLVDYGIRFGSLCDPCLRSSRLDAWFLCAVIIIAAEDLWMVLVVYGIRFGSLRGLCLRSSSLAA